MHQNYVLLFFILFCHHIKEAVLLEILVNLAHPPDFREILLELRVKILL